MRIRLDQLQAELERRNKTPSPADRYPPSPWRRPPLLRASSIDERVSTATAPDREESSALADEWLADRFPLAFGASERLPIDPRLHSIVRDEAAHLPRWSRLAINGRLYRHNTSFRVLVATARPGSQWSTLHGRPYSPIEEAVRRRAAEEVQRLDGPRRGGTT
jgi:hypothetical protein